MKEKIGNIEINYTEIEPKKLNSDSVVAIFLHEALGSIRQWMSFPQELCDQLGVRGMIYDRQGHGESSPFTKERDENYLHDYALQELPAFIELVVPESKNLLLIGHSDGGTISLLYASKFPQRISGIVTMAAHVINEPETITGIQPAINAFELGKLDGLKKYHGEKTKDLFFAWANIWRDDRFKNWNITNEIGSKLPGLFIQGKTDQYGTARQLELIQSRFSNGTSLLLDDCGHHPHLEKKEAVIFAINAFFLKEIS